MNNPVLDVGMPLIQDNPVIDPGTAALSVDHTGACFVRWTQTRDDGALVDCAARVQLVGARIVGVRRPEPRGLPHLKGWKLNMPERSDRNDGN